MQGIIIVKKATAAQHNPKPARAFKGDRLRQIREQMGLSQEALEELLQIGRGSVSRYEAGLADPLPNQLVAMATQLQISTDWLLGVSDDPEGFRPAGTTPKEKLLLSKYRSGELVDLARDLLTETLEPKPPKDTPDEGL